MVEQSYGDWDLGGIQVATFRLPGAVTAMFKSFTAEGVDAADVAVMVCDVGFIGRCFLACGPVQQKMNGIRTTSKCMADLGQRQSARSNGTTYRS